MASSERSAPAASNPPDAAAYLRGMAFHEAGHAVVAWSLNVCVANIHIREVGAGNGGAQIGCFEHLPLTDQLAALAAGKIAERVMAINLVLKHHEGASSDEIEYHLTAGHVRARELLAEHQDRVIRLAVRLLEVHEVDAGEFLRLMGA